MAWLTQQHHVHECSLVCFETRVLAEIGEVQEATSIIGEKASASTRFPGKHLSETSAAWQMVGRPETSIRKDGIKLPPTAGKKSQI